MNIFSLVLFVKVYKQWRIQIGSGLIGHPPPSFGGLNKIKGDERATEENGERKEKKRTNLKLRIANLINWSATFWI